MCALSATTTAQTTAPDQDALDQTTIVEPDPPQEDAPEPTLAEAVAQLGLATIGLVITVCGVWYHIKHPRWLGQARRTVPLPIPVGLVIVGYYLVLVIPSYFVGETGDGPPDQSTLQATAIGYAISAFVTLPIAVMWFIAVWQSRKIEQAGASSQPCLPHPPVFSLKQAVIIPVIAFVLLYPVMALLNLLTAWIVMICLPEHTTPRIAHDTLSILQTSNGLDVWTLIIIGYAIVVAPIVEETVYRGTIQTLLARFGLGPWATIFPVAILFGLSHYQIADPVALPTLVILGVGLGIVYEYTGSLIAPIVVHALFNTTQLVMLYFLTQADATM